MVMGFTDWAMGWTYLDAGAAVALAAAAGNAAAAVHVRFDAAVVTDGDRQVLAAGADGLDLHGELVAHHTRVGEERLVAVESVEVGATDAYPVHAHECHALAGDEIGIGDLGGLALPHRGLDKHDGLDRAGKMRQEITHVSDEFAGEKC